MTSSSDQELSAMRAPVRPICLLSLVLLATMPAMAQTTQPGAGAAPATKPADVPVRQVVLFSSGVGYFEHFGTVTGDGATQLNFKTQQINDILKSLVLQD